jgi:hypothetical protein
LELTYPQTQEEHLSTRLAFAGTLIAARPSKVYPDFVEIVISIEALDSHGQPTGTNLTTAVYLWSNVERAWSNLDRSPITDPVMRVVLEQAIKETPPPPRAFGHLQLVT